MTRLLPATLRGAVAFNRGPQIRAFVAAPFAMTLAGCMYLTPSTGLCVAQACRDFDKDRVALAAATQAAANQTPEPPNVYDKAADFKLVTIGAWRIAIRPTGEVDEKGQQVAVPRLDDSDPTGSLTFRIAFGRSIQAEGGLIVSEGISIVTFNKGFTPSDETNRALLADATRQSMSVLFGGTPQIDEIEASLGGKPGRQISMVGPGALPPAEPPAPGQPSAAPVEAPAIRAIGRCAMHRGRGYVVVVRTLDSLYTRAKTGYDGLFDGFEFLEADPTYPLPSADPNALPSAAASGAPSAGPSAAASAAPAGSPSPTASAAPQGTPLPTPST